MNTFRRLSVPLSTIPIDKTVASRLPFRIAHYYCALPIAQEDEQITVVMAHGEDPATIDVLESVLGSRIIPLQGNAAEIRAALRELWIGQSSDPEARILCWGQRCTAEAVYLRLIAESLSASIVTLDSTVHPVESALNLAQAGDFSLTALDIPEGQRFSGMVRHANTPLLLLGQETTALKHILVVLRGHSPDHRALDWIIPIATGTHAAVTLLYIALPIVPFYTRETRRFQGLGMLLSSETEPGSHVHKCGARLQAAGIKGYLKFRQGPADQQIADEIAEGSYDFIALAAEARGDFVERVLGKLESRSIYEGQPILVMKPSIP